MAIRRCEAERMPLSTRATSSRSLDDPMKRVGFSTARQFTNRVPMCSSRPGLVELRFSSIKSNMTWPEVGIGPDARLWPISPKPTLRTCEIVLVSSTPLERSRRAADATRGR
jgi:hypothetical protein